MAAQSKVMPPIRIAVRKMLNRLMDEVEQRMGSVPDPGAIIEKLREMLRAEGIRPEDNAFSREIIRMRYGDDE